MEAVQRSLSWVRLGQWATQVAALALLYTATAHLGLQFAHHHENATLIWPPTGVALAALIYFGLRVAPGVFLGTLILNSLITPSPMEWLVSLGIAAGNTLEAVLGAGLLRYVKFRPNLARLRDVGAFLLIGVLGCTVVSATIGVASLLASGSVALGGFWPVWLVWWLGDMGGALVVAPALLMLVQGTPSWPSLFQRFEWWLATALLLVTTSFAFSGAVAGLMGFAACMAPFPILVWAGVRLGPRGAAQASFLVVAIAALGTAANRGPFVLGSATEAVILLWVYSMFVGLTSFVLAAVIEQRDLAERRYRSGQADRLLAEKERLLLLERERLTREMHDGLGGQLISALSMVERGVGTPNEVAEMLRRALDDMRIVIDSLDPTTTDLATSLGKLRARLVPLLRRNNVELSWPVQEIPAMQAFPPEMTLHVLRIIQEAVTNAVRHAGASCIDVSVAPTPERPARLRVAIRDDGCGLPPDPSRGGRGIRNMNARAQALDATLRLESCQPGSLVELTVPLDP